MHLTWPNRYHYIVHDTLTRSPPPTHRLVLHGLNMPYSEAVPLGFSWFHLAKHFGYASDFPTGEVYVIRASVVILRTSEKANTI